MVNVFYTLIGIFNLIFVLILISAKNPIHRIAALISIFLTGSFIFILLDNYFLGLTYIIVYVGAIAILFLFVIMLIEQPSVGSNSENNNKIINHSSVLTYDIKNRNFNKRRIKKLSYNYPKNKIMKFKKKEISSLNLQDMITYNKSLNLNDLNNKTLIIKKGRSLFNSEIFSREIIKPEFNIGVLPSLFIFFYIYCETYNKNYYQVIEEGRVLLDFDFVQSNASIEIYNYFYPTWAIEFKIITDIETLGIIIYIAYPFALILISIALWTVMIGIISICSPRRLYDHDPSLKKRED